MEFDIAIIGGGPAGYSTAGEAAAKGLRTILFERNAVGGVCLNEGCIPTKTLLYSAKTLDNAKSAAKYGINIEGEIAFDLSKIVGRKNKVVRKLTAGIRAKLAESGVTTINGVATLVGETDDRIQIACNDEVYSAKQALLCTGSETIIPPIKGLSEIEYWTSKEALESKELPNSLAIIGGGVIGVEFASFFNSLGVKVTVIEMLPEILGAMDKETSTLLRAEYAKKGIDFRMNSKVVEVSSGGITIEQDGQTETIESDRILVSVGRKPVVKDLRLENLNIELLKNGVKVNEYMQTSNPRIYAAGDITGFSLLAHTAIREGEIALSHILGKDEKMSYKAIPAVVYTNPEIAGIGRTEEDLQAKGENYKVHQLPMSYSGRFVAENEMANGLCKVIVDTENRIIGCHILGNPASELIVIAGIAIENGMTISDFKRYVFPHPTVGEILHETLSL